MNKIHLLFPEHGVQKSSASEEMGLWCPSLYIDSKLLVCRQEVIPVVVHTNDYLEVLQSNTSM